MVMDLDVLEMTSDRSVSSLDVEAVGESECCEGGAADGGCLQSDSQVLVSVRK